MSDVTKTNLSRSGVCASVRQSTHPCQCAVRGLILEWCAGVCASAIAIRAEKFFLPGMGRKAARLGDAKVARACAACDQTLTKADFSRSQLKKGGICRCCSQAAAQSSQPPPAQPQSAQPRVQRDSTKPQTADVQDLCFLPDTPAVSSLLAVGSDGNDGDGGGATAPEALSSAALEAARLRAVRSLAGTFRTHCAALGVKRSCAFFENWLWSVRGEGFILDAEQMRSSGLSALAWRERERRRATLCPRGCRSCAVPFHRPVPPSPACRHRSQRGAGPPSAGGCLAGTPRPR